MPPQPPHTHGPQSPDSTDPGADTPANASDIADSAEAAATAELQRSAAARTPPRAAVEQAFNGVGDTSEADQRMPAPRFAEQPVKRDAGNSSQRQVQRGRHIYRKTGGRKRERHEKIAKTKAEFYAD